jgi:hypothetical protein
MAVRKLINTTIAELGKKIVGSVSPAVIMFDNPGIVAPSSNLRAAWRNMAAVSGVPFTVHRLGTIWSVEFEGEIYEIPYDMPLYIWRT